MPFSKDITTKTHLGFIGLGYLGSRIARRLAAAGFPMTVYDRDPAMAEPFSSLGATVATDLAELGRGVDVVCPAFPTTLPSKPSTSEPLMFSEPQNVTPRLLN
ncbi:MAG TPA: NAD(P)-binding domain-containing protein [Bryobacteraceae bacterium]